MIYYLFDNIFFAIATKMSKWDPEDPDPDP